MENLPFVLKEVKVPKSWSEPDPWKPNTDKTYLIEYYIYSPNRKPTYMLGNFHKTWYGFSFHWFWSASSLQLSVNDDRDLKYFQRIWEFHINNNGDLDNNDSDNEEYITDDDIEI